MTLPKKTPTFIRVTGVVVHLVRARDGHGEDVSDLGRVGAALGAQLQDVELLHLQMLDGPAVLQQQTLAAELHLAEGAVVQQLGVSVVTLQLLLLPPQVGEDGGGDLVALVGRVDLQLVDAVGVEITRVAPQLHGVGHVHEVELPLVLGSALHDVVDKLQLLQVFVCLAVELEVGFEISFV